MVIPCRERIKRLKESLLKLNKYCEALNVKKHQRSVMTNNERSGGSNLLKMGFQLPRNSSDIGTQRLENRTKSGVNKRMRSSMARLRVNVGSSRNLERQPAVMGRDRDMLRDGGEGSDVAEEKVHRLDAGGDGCYDDRVTIASCQDILGLQILEVYGLFTRRYDCS